MERIDVIDASQFDALFSDEIQSRAIDALERGAVLFFPKLRFETSDAERLFFSPGLVGKSKNVSYDIRTGKLGGANVADSDAAALAEMIGRYARSARNLLGNLLPGYDAGNFQARASFRPVEVEGRVTSWRKDDSRLHVDSFPSAPTNGKRILRVFANVNSEGRPRVWRIGEPFEDAAKRFVPMVKRPLPGSATLLNLFGITKNLRSEYDHYMLQMHDRMKADDQYQKEVDQITHEFPAGSTWMAFADQVSHAAMRGQFQFEQTFVIPVARQQNPNRSPLRVLERLVGRTLA